MVEAATLAWAQSRFLQISSAGQGKRRLKSLPNSVSTREPIISEPQILRLELQNPAAYLLF
jgi:hypothetical protein